MDAGQSEGYDCSGVDTTVGGMLAICSLKCELSRKDRFRIKKVCGCL